ncbi:lipid storage droplets surface-binding protein 1 isoform X2 [Chironomus tepperi]|uniref:lipid storage droplets surface-binding protein 1 isoform X2 n=1 Tax=Chironomus tepperi TaxID=113505 RepID=UPI00391F2F6B
MVTIHTHSNIRMESFDKFTSIPIVESSLKTGYVVYNRFKNSNRLINWSLNVSENVTFALIEAIKPALNIVEGPLNKIDNFGVKILESVESVVPNINLPPQMIYWNTKEYVSDRVVKPVMKRADSFGDIADHALIFADKAVDKYLPDDTEDETDSVDGNGVKVGSHAVLTYRRSKRLTKKIKTRLSCKTAAEIRALKDDVHILFYAMELIVKDPKEALVKFRELYAYLSQKEPENQQRPETLEQLFVLLSRETARKIVHLINFTTKHLNKVPRKIRQSLQEFFHHVLYWTDSILKTIQSKHAQSILSTIHTNYEKVQEQTNNALERLAIFCSGRLDAEKIQMSNRNRIYTRPTSINGLY